jgi:hypothetical protein
VNLKQGDRVRLMHTDLEGSVVWVSAARFIHVELEIPEAGKLFIGNAEAKFFVKQEGKCESQ